MKSPFPKRWAAAGTVGALALLASGSGPAALAQTPTGEMGANAPDVVLALHDGRLSLELRGGPLEPADPADASPTGTSPMESQAGPIVLDESSRTAVPDDQRYSFLGQPGTTVWQTASSPGTDAQTSGWDTTGVAKEALAKDAVRWRLTEVEGPGDVVVHTQPGTDPDTAEPNVLFDSRDDLPDQSSLPAGESGPLTWMFTQEGEYGLTGEADVTLASGAPAQAVAHWTVQVGSRTSQEPSEPPTLSPAGSGTDSGQASARGATTLATPGTEAQPRAANDVAIASKRTVIADGHVDALAGHMVNGGLRLLFKDSRDPNAVVWREPSSVVVHVIPKAKETIPSGSAYHFLGTSGSPFWMIPQTQKAGIVWAGWNTEALTGNDLEGAVELRLTKVSGPGALAVWETGALGSPEVIYNSRDGLPDRQRVNLGVHAHANWGFSKQGIYRVTFQLRGTLKSGKAAADTRTYTFAVGDVDTSKVNPGAGSGDENSTSGSSSSGSNGSGKSGGSGNGSLAHTGQEAAIPLGLVAGALIATGTAAVSLGRTQRRRAAAAHAQPSGTGQGSRWPSTRPEATASAAPGRRPAVKRA